MKVVHWAWLNGSGMGNVAASLSGAERALGLDSVVGDAQCADGWEALRDADLHVCHTHIPDAIRTMATKPYRYVYVGHGTPEHVYQSSVEAGTRTTYGAADGWMLLQEWLRTADAVVTFWPRHQAIYQSLSDKGRVIDCVPMGIDTAFWRQGASRGRYAGAPAVLTAENQHYIKWILDAVIAWPWVTAELPDARLHALYLPKDQHRWLFPLINRNGASYRGYFSANVLPPEDLRNAFQSTDFYLGLVRYGDHNHIGLQASAAGSAVISYAGNPYADFWIPEGDQRVIAETLIRILRGDEPRRAKRPVPTLEEMAQATTAVYERVLTRGGT